MAKVVTMVVVDGIYDTGEYKGRLIYFVNKPLYYLWLFSL